MDGLQKVAQNLINNQQGASAGPNSLPVAGTQSAAPSALHPTTQPTAQPLGQPRPLAPPGAPLARPGLPLGTAQLYRPVGSTQVRPASDYILNQGFVHGR